jgi:hypothetical protein
MANRISNRPRACFRAFALIAVLGHFVSATTLRADRFSFSSGYTRPGTPSDRIEAGGKILSAIDDKDGQLGIGATVYFTVYDRAAQSVQGDTWGTGRQDFDAAFRAGRGSDLIVSPALDGTARYLYVYQVVNDRKTQGVVHGCSVQLLVDPRRITSWGHFTGVGFAYEMTDKDAKNVVLRPVSAAYPLISEKRADRLFFNPAYAVETVRALRLEAVGVWSMAKGAPGQDKDPAHDPDPVIVFRSADFHGVPARAGEVAVVGPNVISGLPSGRAAIDGNRYAALRAVWTGDRELRPGNRSCVFGFTSNLPPTFALVRIHGAVAGEKPAADNGTMEGGVLADGEVPTPYGEEESLVVGFQAPLPDAFFGTPAGALAPFGAPVGAIGTAGAPFICTGAGLGGSNGSTYGTLQQQQQQQQQQQGSSDPSEVVPEPAAFIPALLGLPFLFLLMRRKAMPGSLDS